MKDKIEKEARAIEFDCPMEVTRLYRHNVIPSGQGSRDQAFTTMVFAEGDLRSLAFISVLSMCRIIDEPALSLDGLKITFNEFVSFSAEFLGTCGLEKIWELTQDVKNTLPSVESKEEFKELMEMFAIYVTALHGWVHHMFPWYVGDLFPQKRAEHVEELAKYV